VAEAAAAAEAGNTDTSGFDGRIHWIAKDKIRK